MTTVSAIAPADEQVGHPTLDLRISDPVSLLNEIARRYGSVERILMEYVDNALDDAETLYRANAESYPFTVRIEVIIDASDRTVTVRDNCRGMLPQVLERVVANVGESTKKGLTWVNGRFGFGVHAFRACAESIRFRTKNHHGDHLELQLNRKQHYGIRRPWQVDAPFPTDTGTGTEITLGPFDPASFQTVTADSIKREIEGHFERLLARPDLAVTVSAAGEVPATCQPFDYASIPGTEFKHMLHLERGTELHEIEVCLKVAETAVSGRASRFFARGRRINEIAEIRSFIRKSTHRTSVWEHPNLIGFIEVSEIVRPVITRDDFDRTEGRFILYRAILELEPDIKAALDRVNDAHRDTSLTRLEDVLRNVLQDIAREDRLRLRSELHPGTDTGRLTDGGGTKGGPDGGPTGEHREGGAGGGSGEGGEGGPDPASPGTAVGTSDGGNRLADDPAGAAGTPRRRSGLDVVFMSMPPEQDGRLRRSQMVDGTVYINSDHADFLERLAHSRQGRPKFTDRLGAYLASTVSIHYKDQFYARYGRQPERRDQLFDEQVDFICRLESALRAYLPLLEQELAGSFGDDDDAHG